MAPTTLHHVHTLPPQPPLYTATLTPTSHHLALAGAAPEITLWNPYTPRHLTTLSAAHSHQILTTSFNAPADRLVSAGLDPPLYLWDLHTSTLLRKLRAHKPPINRATFTAHLHPALILSASYDTTVKLWDTRAANPHIHSLPPFRDSVTSLLSTHHQIIAASVDNTLRIFDIRASTIATHHFDAPLAALALSRDRHCILVASLDHSLYILQRTTGTILAKYTGHRNANFPVDCAFLHDDSALLAGSEDGNLCLWNLDASSQPPLTSHLGSVVAAVAAHNHQNLVIAATHHGHASVWAVT